ncbi:hypothetical protein Hanom_Chr16g01451081 [Helianthus anomalus]
MLFDYFNKHRKTFAFWYIFILVKPFSFLSYYQSFFSFFRRTIFDLSPCHVWLWRRLVIYCLFYSNYREKGLTLP